jgi:ATP-dependent RNA circularization protein (DNA/RNA ligase family)
LAQRLNIDFSRIAQESHDNMKKNKAKDREKLMKEYGEAILHPKDSTISKVLAYGAII